MKRNRKAEAKKKARLRASQYSEVHRVNVLLNEMRIASGQVLREHFEFTQDQIVLFFQLIEVKFKEIRREAFIFHQDKRMASVAKRFGVAAMYVLNENFSFGESKLNEFIKKLIEQGDKNREVNDEHRTQ